MFVQLVNLCSGLRLRRLRQSLAAEKRRGKSMKPWRRTWAAITFFCLWRVPERLSRPIPHVPAPASVSRTARTQHRTAREGSRRYRGALL